MSTPPHLKLHPGFAIICPSVESGSPEYGGFFVNVGRFERVIINMGPLKSFFLQIWVMSSGERTTILKKSSSKLPVSTFFFFLFFFN